MELLIVTVVMTALVAGLGFMVFKHKMLSHESGATEAGANMPWWYSAGDGAGGGGFFDGGGGCGDGGGGGC